MLSTARSTRRPCTCANPPRQHRTRPSARSHETFDQSKNSKLLRLARSRPRSGRALRSTDGPSLLILLGLNIHRYPCDMWSHDVRLAKIVLRMTQSGLRLRLYGASCKNDRSSSPFHDVVSSVYWCVKFCGKESGLVARNEYLISDVC